MFKTECSEFILALIELVVSPVSLDREITESGLSRRIIAPRTSRMS
jgi:hypothetical protein